MRSRARSATGVVLAVLIGGAGACGGSSAPSGGGSVTTSGTGGGSVATSAGGGGSVLTTDPSGGKVALHAHRGRHTYTRVQLQAGDLIRCGNAGARVQPPGQGTGAFADGIGSSSDLQLTTNPDGSVVIDCSPGK